MGNQRGWAMGPMVRQPASGVVKSKMRASSVPAGFPPPALSTLPPQAGGRSTARSSGRGPALPGGWWWGPTMRPRATSVLPVPCRPGGVPAVLPRLPVGAVLFPVVVVVVVPGVPPLLPRRPAPASRSAPRPASAPPPSPASRPEPPPMMAGHTSRHSYVSRLRMAVAAP